MHKKTKKAILLLLKLIVSTMLVFWLLKRIGLDKIMAQLRDVDYLWFCGALVLFSASLVLGSYQWWLLLRAEGIAIPWKKALSFYYVGLFFNNFLISSMGGDVFRMLDLRKYSGKSAVSRSTVFLDRFIGLFILSSGAMAALPWLLLTRDIPHQLLYVGYLLFICWLVLIFFFFSKRFARPLGWIIRRYMPDKIHARAREIYRQIHGFGRKPRLLLKVLSIAVVVQLARIFMHYLVARSVGVDVHPFYFIIFIPIIAIAASLPVSLGGIGLRENTGVKLFQLAGVAVQTSAAFEFLAYVVAIITALPGGIIFIFRKREKDYENR